MAERASWWRRLLCRWLGHDEQQLWSKLLPLAECPEPAPQAEPVPGPGEVVLVVPVREFGLDTLEISSVRCRRCGLEHVRRDLVRTGPPREYERYVVVAAAEVPDG